MYQQASYINYTGNINIVRPTAVPIPRQSSSNVRGPNPDDPKEKQKRYKLEQQRKFRNFGNNSIYLK